MIEIILPAILTIVGNVIFYLWVRKRVDRSIEQFKITYSGVLKEKINIYRKILDKSYRIQILINRHHLTGDKEKAYEFTCEIENFIHFYLKNQPFISENMLDKLKKIRSEFQLTFEGSQKYYYLYKTDGVSKEDKNEMMSKFIEVGNKFKAENNPFKNLITALIREMRSDLKTDKLKN